MEVYTNMKHVGMVAMVLAVCVLVVCQTVALAQNLGAAPQVNVAVQGQTGAQPEGAFLNFVNWVGNVIAPVGAGVAVVATRRSTHRRRSNCKCNLTCPRVRCVVPGFRMGAALIKRHPTKPPSRQVRCAWPIWATSASSGSTT